MSKKGDYFHVFNCVFIRQHNTSALFFDETQITEFLIKNGWKGNSRFFKDLFIYFKINSYLRYILRLFQSFRINQI